MSTSPLRWIGGKHYLAQHIIDAFPPANNYDCYVEPFGGAAHVLLQKPKMNHIEIFNDVNSDLVNFWIQCRDHAQLLQDRCESLPYARSVYYDYHKSLFDGTVLDPIERATRWFYVLRSSFLAEVRVSSPHGWWAGPVKSGSSAYCSAMQLFGEIKTRFRRVEIDNRDFEYVIKVHQSSRTLFYCDPPYIDVEKYYVGGFSLDDHKRLSKLLNTTDAMVALSYYPHSLLDELYPDGKWRRVYFDAVKHSQRRKDVHEKTTEMLLCNYPENNQMTLWDEVSA